MTNSWFSHKITALALIGVLGLPPSFAWGLRAGIENDIPDKLAAGLEARVSQEDLDDLPVLSRLVILYGARKRIPSGDDDPAVTLQDWAAFRAQDVGAEGLISPERRDALRRAFLTAGGRMFLSVARIPASPRAFEDAFRRIHSLSGRRLTANGKNRNQGEPKPLLALLPLWVAESQQEVARIIRARAQGAAQPIGPGTRLEILDRAPGLDNLDRQGAALNLGMLQSRLSSGRVGLSVRFPEKEGSPYTLELTRADTHKVQLSVIQKRLASLRRFHEEVNLQYLFIESKSAAGLEGTQSQTFAIQVKPYTGPQGVPLGESEEASQYRGYLLGELKSLVRQIKDWLSRTDLVLEGSPFTIIQPDAYYELAVGTQTDQVKMGTVIENALDEFAILATSQGAAYDGRITIRVQKTNNQLLLELEDNGRGIPKEKLPSLFREVIPEEDRKDPNWLLGGVGVAMMIGTYGDTLVAAHGGRIEVDTFHSESGPHLLVYTPAIYPGMGNITVDRGTRQQVGTTIRWVLNIPVLSLETSAGLEGVTVEVARVTDPAQAQALAKEIFRVRGKRKGFERLTSPRAFSEILQGRVADQALVVAQREGSDNYLIKDVSTRRSHSSLENVETFSAEKFSEKYRAQYQERLGPTQREIIDAFLNQEGAQFATAKIDLTQIPIYVQSRELYDLVREHLRPMYPGVLFYVRPIPEDPGELERFQWENLGLILAREGQEASVPNPRGLPVLGVAAEESAISGLDPMDLLARIYRNVLGVPPEAENVRATLFTDAEGNARLILMYV